MHDVTTDEKNPKARENCPFAPNPQEMKVKLNGITVEVG